MGPSFGGRIPFRLERRENGEFHIKNFYLAASADDLNGVRMGERVIGLAESATGKVVPLDGMTVGQTWALNYGQPGSEVDIHLADLQGTRRAVRVKRIKASGESSPARVAFAPDGQSLAIADTVLGTTRWSPTNHVPAQRFASPGVAVAYGPQGRFLATGFVTEVLLWDLLEDRLHHRWDAEVAPGPADGDEVDGSLAFSPDGQYVAWGTGLSYASDVHRSDLRVWEVHSLDEISEAPLFENDTCVTYVQFTPDSRLLVAADHAGMIRLWEVSTWQRTHEFETNRHLWAMAISPDGATLAVGGQGGLLLWNLESGTLEKELSNDLQVMSLAYSPDGRTLATGQQDHSVRLWDVRTGMPLRTAYAHTDFIFGIDFSPNGNTLATTGREGNLRLWKAASLDVIEEHPLTRRSNAKQASPLRTPPSRNP